MKWKNRIKLALDLVNQTIQTFNLEKQDHILHFARTELNEYYNGNYFNELSENDREHESKLILGSYIGLCNNQFIDYRNKTYKIIVEQVNAEIAKQKLVADYFNDMREGNDDIASMNINDWIQESGIIIVDDVSSSSVE